MRALFLGASLDKYVISFFRAFKGTEVSIFLMNRTISKSKRITFLRKFVLGPSLSLVSYQKA